MRRLILALAIAAVLLTCTAAQQEKKSRGKASTQKTAVAQVKPESPLDRERFEFDKQKYQSDHDLELKKLELEREKLSASQSFWSELVAGVPLLIAVGTLVWGIVSFQKQARQQAAAQLEAAKLQFELKAAEIVFSAKTPEAAANKARSLVTMFPERLPNFAKGFDPNAVGGGKEDPEGKKVFLESILKYPGNDAKVFDLWKEMFGDDWLDRVQPVVQHYAAQAAQQAAAQPTQVSVTGSLDV